MNNVDQLIHEVTVFVEFNQLRDSDRCELGPRQEQPIKKKHFEDSLLQDGRHKAGDRGLKTVPELQTAKTGQ
jgi:hypothetical protein